MIISFEFQNHHSYKDEQSFSMERPHNIALEHDSIRSDRYSLRLSRVAAIYGANASGKSGFISALQFLQQTISTGRIHCNPFLLSRDRYMTPSTYSLNFIANNGVRYQYDLTCKNFVVIAESLAIWDSQKPSALFYGVRNGNRIEYKFGDKFTSRNTRNMVEKELTPDGEHPLLYLLCQIKEGVTRPAYDFITQGMFLYSADDYADIYHDVQGRAVKDTKLLDILNSILPAIDLGISGITIDTPPKRFVDEFLKERSAADREEFISRNTRLAFQHAGDGADFRLGYIRESRGTIAALALLSVAYEALRDGSVCIVDELDSSLHPLLVSQLVEVFNGAATNPHGAQLIFTTHDASLIERHMNQSLFDRDQIWFVEKDSKGRSQLYALTEIDIPRESENIGVKYLHGRYGATPNIALVDRIEQLIEEGKM